MAAGEYRIGSFNLNNLGYSALGADKPRDIQKIARIIRETEFDIVALQEVLSEGRAFLADGVKRSVLSELGPNWGFAWAEAGSNSGIIDHRHEGYAFLWDRRRVDLVTTDVNGDTRVAEPAMYKRHFHEMRRHPYIARFSPTNLRDLEIRLICVHTYFSDPQIGRRELEALYSRVYPWLADRPARGCAYTILLGDYNAELTPGRKNANDDGGPFRATLGKGGGMSVGIAWNAEKPGPLPDVLYIPSWGNKAIRTVQYEPSTVGKDGYVKNYDHFSYDADRVQHIVRKVERITKYSDGDTENYCLAVSDHVPVMLTLKIN